MEIWKYGRLSWPSLPSDAPAGRRTREPLCNYVNRLYKYAIPHICKWKLAMTLSRWMRPFYQRVSIASYASAGIARAEMSVRPSISDKKCSPGIAVSSEIKFMWIFAGVRWPGGFKIEWSRQKWRFSLILPAITSELPHLRPQSLYCAM